MQLDGTPIGRIGVWSYQLEGLDAGATRERAAEIEELGYGALWYPETLGREAFTNAMLLLGATSTMAVASGIASIWGREPSAAAAAHKTVSAAFSGRFLFGMGVSHQPMVEGVLGATYDRPYSHMRDYLDRMDASMFMASPPPVAPRRVLAALGPRMLRLAADRADGAFPYFVPPEHTAIAREALGPEPLLAVEQAVVLETDPARARDIARSNHLRIYTPLPNYTNNLRRLGFGDDDFDGAGSDKLVDAIVAWGDESAVVDRVTAHLDAGADHVCVQVIGEHFMDVPVDGWRRLAPALLGL